MGTPAFAVPSLAALSATEDVTLVLCNPDRPGRARPGHGFPPREGRGGQARHSRFPAGKGPPPRRRGAHRGRGARPGRGRRVRAHPPEGRPRHPEDDVRQRPRFPPSEIPGGRADQLGGGARRDGDGDHDHEDGRGDGHGADPPCPEDADRPGGHRGIDVREAGGPRRGGPGRGARAPARGDACGNSPGRRIGDVRPDAQKRAREDRLGKGGARDTRSRPRDDAVAVRNGGSRREDDQGPLPGGRGGGFPARPGNPARLWTPGATASPWHAAAGFSGCWPSSPRGERSWTPGRTRRAAAWGKGTGYRKGCGDLGPRAGGPGRSLRRYRAGPRAPRGGLPGSQGPRAGDRDRDGNLAAPRLDRFRPASVPFPASREDRRVRAERPAGGGVPALLHAHSRPGGAERDGGGGQGRPRRRRRGFRERRAPGASSAPARSLPFRSRGTRAGRRRSCPPPRPSSRRWNGRWGRGRRVPSSWRAWRNRRSPCGPTRSVQRPPGCCRGSPPRGWSPHRAASPGKGSFSRNHRRCMRTPPSGRGPTS